MPFNYGAEVVAPRDPYKLWPTEGDMTALLDGDMLPYVVGYSTDPIRALRAYNGARFLHGKEPDASDWKWVECLLQQPYFKDKVEHLNTTLNAWVEGAEADSAIVYLTTSANNYRLDIAFSHVYKGARPKDKPPFFYELRTYLKVMHKAVVADGEEADDLMSIEQWKDILKLKAEGALPGSQRHKSFATTVIVSKDKDLRIVPGWNYNPDSKEKLWVDAIGWLEPKMVEATQVKYEQWPLFGKEPVDPNGNDCYQGEDFLYYLLDGTKQDHYSRGANAGKGKFKRMATGYHTVEVIDSLKGAGLKFFYSQLITGDNVDNYKGIPGAGATLAYETLNHLTTEDELYEAVLNLYISKRCSGANELWAENHRGGRALLTPLQFMLEQGRLAHMQRFPGDLWMPDLYCPTGVDSVWKS